MAYAIEPTEKLRLKTLDLLHLAYIKAIREQGLWIHALLTADTDFKDIEKDLQESLGVTINLLTPHFNLHPTPKCGKIHDLTIYCFQPYYLLSVL